MNARRARVTGRREVRGRETPIGITLGDPAGIGAEVVLKALASRALADVATVVIGDPEVLRETAARLGVRRRIAVVDAPTTRPPAGYVAVLRGPALGPRARRPGHPTIEGGRASYEWIVTAARLALAGEIAAIVTAPISKEWVTRAGVRISGHTELLRDLTGASDVRMMLAAARLRVVLVTMHVAHRAVAAALDVGSVARTIAITNAHLRRYAGIARPRIAVCGLNPHAGEGGLFGDEERTVIGPAVARARRGGVDARGPFASDALFFHAVAGAYDAVVAMYHDQGLIPLKLLHFHDGVNVTLGLPVIRTSPDHGTAYDIAGTGTAHAGSMTAAVLLAARMARGRRPARRATTRRAGAAPTSRRSHA